MDKAQMDVEAQDDGILAKIVIPNGTQNVKVGKIIAMLAEEGDDISSIEVSAEDNAMSGLAVEAKTAIKTHEETKVLMQKESQENKRHLHFDTTYPPAVLRLLHEHAIEDPKSIPTTGPRGRLLKGDVLAHVGSVKVDVPKTLKDILVKKTSLDLSNITLQQPQPSQSQSLPPSLLPAKSPTPAHVDAVIRLSSLFKIQRQLSG